MRQLKYILWLNTEKAVESYRSLKKRAHFRERAIMKSFERYVFREKLLAEEQGLPMGVEVECLNTIIAGRIKWPAPIREAYEKLGCVEGLDFDIVEVADRAVDDNEV